MSELLFLPQHHGLSEIEKQPILMADRPLFQFHQLKKLIDPERLVAVAVYEDDAAGGGRLVLGEPWESIDLAARLAVTLWASRSS